MDILFLARAMRYPDPSSRVEMGNPNKMSIKINIPSYMKSFTSNMRVVEVNGSTVGECLSHFCF